MFILANSATGSYCLPKPVVQNLRSSTSCLKFQNIIFSIRSSSICLRPLPRLLFPSIFSSVTGLEGSSCARHDIQLDFLRLMYAACSPLPWLSVILLNFWHGGSDWSSPSFCRPTFHNFQVIFWYCPNCLKFPHNANLCSKCNFSLVSSVNSSPIC
jgi:Tubulin